MRCLVTFIVRLWVDVQADPPIWEGQVECVASAELRPIRTPEELLAFIATHTTMLPPPPETEATLRRNLSSTR